MKTDTAAHATTIPGLVLRPYAGEADIPAIARIQNAEWKADGLKARTSHDELAAEYGQVSAGFDPARDIRIAVVDGTAVGFCMRDWADATDGVREYRSRGYMEPAWRRRGIGTALLADAGKRARDLARSHETDRPRIQGTISNDTNPGAAALAERFGFARARWFFDMERPLPADLPDIGPLPAGIDVRTATQGDVRAIWDADHEAFRDHWGGHDSSDANLRRWTSAPEFDPSLFILAWDGDDIAAGVLNAIYPWENEELGIQRGWLDSVFTRRPWRRRGLARSLIVRSLHLLRERGMTSAALGVDADNPSGALGLYESAGFAVTEKTTAWRKPLEEGPFT
ncbi:MAG: GNAT family N-acetyltransferase [Candidatus Limnocylindria bacterium]